jgi:endoglucanase
MKTAGWMAGLWLSCGAGLCADPARIALNQAGYRTGDEKDFRVAAPAAGFEILDVGGRVVFRGKLTGPLRDEPAGCDVWRGDFTGLEKPGTYTVRLEDGTSSWPFRIGGDVYAPLLQMALRGLYVSRCGCAVVDEAVGHPPCHQAAGSQMLLDGKTVPSGREVSGAWHNGGDYRRSTMSAAQTISRLLWPEELHPGACDAVPSGLLPGERRDTLPDLLTEALWGLDWLGKMQDPDGGVSIGLGPATNTMPRHVPPQEDPSEYFLGAAYSSNTGKAGAVFARAAWVLRGRDAKYSGACLARARACWEYLRAHPEPVCPPTCVTYVKKTDDDDRLWLAVEIFRTTGEEAFHEEFLGRFAKLESAYPPAPVSTQTIRNYNLHEALISYCFLGERADKGVREKILAGLRAGCDRMVEQSQAAGYGSALTAAHWKERHTMGNMLQMAWELAMAWELTGHAPYREAALRQWHFALGANPLGKVSVAIPSAIRITGPSASGKPRPPVWRSRVRPMTGSSS